VTVLLMPAGQFAGCRAVPEPTSLMLSESEVRSAPTLKVGDPAPPVVVSEWLHGAPLALPEAGKVCVLDFWASWCGPCLAIMPRISALQARHEGRVVVVAITAIDGANPRRRVRHSLDEIEGGVRFRVAIDGGPQGRSTVAAYMRAARETSIPRTFVIDQHGLIAWIGHPKDAGPVVEAVLAGTWDIDLESRKRRRDMEERRAGRELVAAWIAARERGDRPGELAALDALARLSPENIPYVPNFAPAAARIALLCDMDQAGRAREAFAVAMADQEFAVEPWALAEFAAALRKVAPEDADRAALRANELLQARRAAARAPGDAWDVFLRDAYAAWDAEALEVLAAYWYARGDHARALTLIDGAIALTDPQDPEFQGRSELRRAYDAAGRATSGQEQ
jgi:thiol-disulfide isomerase/thioredoxin